MTLLLTHAYFLADDAKEREIMRPYAPLGLLYLSSHLRAKGLSVEIYDSTFGTKADLFSTLRHGPPSALGVYANLMTRQNALEIIACAHEAGWIVVAGGWTEEQFAEKRRPNPREVAEAAPDNPV